MIYQFSVKKWWKTVGKVFGILVVIGAIIGGGVWGWFAYQNRTAIVEELYGVRIGMTPLEVQLAKGEPDIVFPDALEEPTDEDLESLPWWVFKVNPVTDAYVTLGFAEGGEAGLYVETICQRKTNRAVLMLAKGDSENEVIDKLGEPSHTSVSSKGLSKYISYESWKVTFEIEKGEVSAICISESGRVTFKPEYGDEATE